MAKVYSDCLMITCSQDLLVATDVGSLLLELNTLVFSRVISYDLLLCPPPLVDGHRWLDPLNKLLGEVSEKFSEFFSGMGCAGEVQLSESEVGSI